MSSESISSGDNATVGDPIGGDGGDGDGVVAHGCSLLLGVRKSNDILVAGIHHSDMSALGASALMEAPSNGLFGPLMDASSIRGATLNPSPAITLEAEALEVLALAVGIHLKNGATVSATHGADDRGLEVSSVLDIRILLHAHVREVGEFLEKCHGGVP